MKRSIDHSDELHRKRAKSDLNGFVELPTEIICIICSELDVYSVVSVLSTCSHLFIQFIMNREMYISILRNVLKSEYINYILLSVYSCRILKRRIDDNGFIDFAKRLTKEVNLLKRDDVILPISIKNGRLKLRKDNIFSPLAEQYIIQFVVYFMRDRHNVRLLLQAVSSTKPYKTEIDIFKKLTDVPLMFGMTSFSIVLLELIYKDYHCKCTKIS